MCSGLGQQITAQALAAQLDPLGLRPRCHISSQAQRQPLGVSIHRCRLIEPRAGAIQAAVTQQPACFAGQCQGHTLAAIHGVDHIRPSTQGNFPRAARCKAGEVALQHTLCCPCGALQPAQVQLKRGAVQLRVLRM
ncbi:hypothetical protein D3C80_1417830 [compost metagenome]